MLDHRDSSARRGTWIRNQHGEWIYRANIASLDYWAAFAASEPCVGVFESPVVIFNPPWFLNVTNTGEK